MDMCKAMQLCISEQVSDRDGLLRLQMRMSADGTEMLAGSTAAPRIRQIAIPTTIATSEWTPVSTPIDDQTHLKARFVVPDGAPRGIVYDPALLARTPLPLLLATGVRGLDHAINTACSLHPHPFASLLAEKAIQLYVENLPRLRDRSDLEDLQPVPAGDLVHRHGTDVGAARLQPLDGAHRRPARRHSAQRRGLRADARAGPLARRPCYGTACPDAESAGAHRELCGRARGTAGGAAHAEDIGGPRAESGAGRVLHSARTRSSASDPQQSSSDRNGDELRAVMALAGATHLSSKVSNLENVHR